MRGVTVPGQCMADTSCACVLLHLAARSEEVEKMADARLVLLGHLIGE